MPDREDWAARFVLGVTVIFYSAIPASLLAHWYFPMDGHVFFYVWVLVGGLVMGILFSAAAVRPEQEDETDA